MACHKTELWQTRALKTRSGPSYVCCQLEVVFEIQKDDAGKGLGETRIPMRCCRTRNRENKLRPPSPLCLVDTRRLRFNCCDLR
jgi:hypothetical protein